ncbi:MAG: phosphatidylserine decarboxylase [Eggerthellaceae bacterium]|nr:phosphatidylserine decarboxylase [Eggerthellaceae bacterium]
MNYNRSTGFLYNTFWGSVVRVVARRPVFSRCYGALQKRKSSKRKIDALIALYGIDTSEFAKQDFESFNDFIIRDLKPGSRPIGKGLIAPADSQLLALKISDDVILNVKGKGYTVGQLIQEQSHRFGLCLIFRLEVQDYHHYCFPDDGETLSHKHISGVLDSVNLPTTGKFALATNVREVSLLQTESFGKMAYVEVGALLVGRIVNTHQGARFAKGDEKGYFEFGGSTVVLLLEKDAAAIKPAILESSRQGKETRVRQGETLSC